MNIYNKIGDIKYKNILLFQGPMGGFFDRLDKEFQDKEAITFRLGLNAGDKFFASFDNYMPFKKKKEDFKEFIIEFYKSHNIDMIFLMGDCRYYQKIAIEVARNINIDIFVFEEGYIRPNFITLERNGVNANSDMSRDRKFYDQIIVNEDLEKNVKQIDSTYGKMALEATLYYVISNLLKYQYPHYTHHRNFSFLLEAFYGVRNFFRKIKYKIIEKNLEKRYETLISKKYFFVPLQTYGDFQILEHSKYNNMEEFIVEILESFSRFSNKNNYLVFKHHPIDRGRCNYTNFINDCAKRLGCIDRVDILFDVHLPTLLRNAKGTITVNSTVGLSSLYHNTPTICLGKSIYDIDGLTSKQLTIDDFWQTQQNIDKKLFIKYKYWLIKNTQINDNFFI